MSVRSRLDKLENAQRGAGVVEVWDTRDDDGMYSGPAGQRLTRAQFEGYQAAHPDTVFILIAEYEVTPPPPGVTVKTVANVSYSDL